MEKINKFLDDNNYVIMLVISLIVTMISIILLQDISVLVLTFILSFIIIYLLSTDTSLILKVIVSSVLTNFLDIFICTDKRSIIWKIPYRCILAFYTCLIVKKLKT
jgi:hypothetical protein